MQTQTGFERQQLDMSVPGATNTTKTATPAPTKTGADSSKHAQDFKDAVNRSTTSNNGPQQSHSAFNASPMILATRPPINLAADAERYLDPRAAQPLDSLA